MGYKPNDKAKGRIAANQAHIIEAGRAADNAQHQSNRKHIHGARAPPAVRLLDKGDVTTIANVSAQTLWAWMRAGTFPRGRIVGGKTMWRSDEIDQWLAGLMVRPLKGDPPSKTKQEEEFA
jgi:predicted DNA-binding transcriptional regulator AlpA